MPNDLGSIAENALDELEQADANNGGTPPNPDGGDDAPAGDESDENENNDNTPAGGEDENAENGEASEENNEGEDDSEAESEDEDESAKGDAAKGKQAQELTDEELLAELEKRGKKPEAPEKKDDKPEDKPKPRPTEVPENVWGEMNDFQRTVYEKLPYLEARGKDGNVLRVKSHQQIPSDFEWANEAAERQFYNIDMPAQSVQAERIAGQLQGQTQQQQQQEQFQKDADMVVKGIEALQTQGIVPKITAQPGTDEFNADPGVQRANEILTLRREYLSRGENISIETAGRIFKAEHPDLYKPKVTKSPADAERKKASRNISGGGRGTAGDAKKGGEAKPKVFPVGTSAEDIADYYADQLD